jgi:hypothetical protein
MPIQPKTGRWAERTAALLLACLLAAGCSGITPYHPRNHREEGPERGIFTGSKGEVVIPVPNALQAEEDTAGEGQEKNKKSE